MKMEIQRLKGVRKLEDSRKEKEKGKPSVKIKLRQWFAYSPFPSFRIQGFPLLLFFLHVFIPFSLRNLETFTLVFPKRLLGHKIHGRWRLSLENKLCAAVIAEAWLKLCGEGSYFGSVAYVSPSYNTEALLRRCNQPPASQVLTDVLCSV